MAAPLYQISAVELHELSITKFAVVPDPGTVFNFEVKIDSNVDPAQKLIMLSTTIRIKDESRESELGSLVCVCGFSVTNFNEVVKVREEKPFEIEASFADTLNSIAISTTRGVMYSELKGTALHMAILPLVDVKTLKKVDAVAL